jgi:CRISPR/Cas system-associated protein Cas5 (RAMP superfamily)
VTSVSVRNTKHGIVRMIRRYKKELRYSIRTLPIVLGVFFFFQKIIEQRTVIRIYYVLVRQTYLNPYTFRSRATKPIDNVQTARSGNRPRII